MSLVKALRDTLRSKVGKHIVHQHIQQQGNNRQTLDIGCGDSPTAKDFPNRIGIDLFPFQGIDVLADAHYLPFANGSFEQIVCSEVLEHLHNPQQAVKEMARILQDGGNLILTMPFVYPLHEAPYDFQRFTAYGLEVLFRPYFEIKEIRALFSEEETLAILLQRIAFQRADSVVRRYTYLALAHFIFRFAPNVKSRRYQHIGHNTLGPFMTAGYMLLATKKNPHE